MRKKFELHGSLENTLPPPHSFGQSLDMNDNYVVIGADDLSMVNTHECGGIYVFDKEYNELQYFYTDRNKSFYGWDVSITDYNDIIVGADDEDNKSSYNGSAFIFKKCETGGFYIHKKLLAIHNKEGAYFGYAVDNNNKYVAISAPSYQSCSNKIVRSTESDYVYYQPFVYIYDTVDFNLVTILTIDHPILPKIHPSFGCNIKFSEDYLVISEHTYNKIYVYNACNFKLLHVFNTHSAVSMDLCGKYLVTGNPKERTITFFDLERMIHLSDYSNQNINNYGYKVALNENNSINMLAVVSNKNTDYMYENVVMNTDSEGKVYIYENKNFNELELIDIREEFYQSLKFYKDKLYCGNPIANSLYGVVDVYSA